MKVIDPGHHYELLTLDCDKPDYLDLLRFVKREGPGYPGNVGSHEGTTTQEVLRALIDRTRYVDNQIPHNANKIVLYYLQMSIWELEKRAADRHGRDFPFEIKDIELQPICQKCGHIGCNEHEEKS